eukprot:gene14565-19554_t
MEATNLDETNNSTGKFVVSEARSYLDLDIQLREQNVEITMDTVYTAPPFIENGELPVTRSYLFLVSNSNLISRLSVDEELLNSIDSVTISDDENDFSSNFIHCLSQPFPNSIITKNVESSFHPYLKYGGEFEGDSKDTEAFKYVTFKECPKFEQEHRSLMAKTLTPELFNKLKEVKSSKGYTLSNVIQTGVVTPHLGVGCTAGDEESWELFKDLFYPVIKAWHGYDAYTQKHPMDLDPSKLLFSDEQREMFSKYVVSTRIRAARNISGFSLPSGVTSEERAGVEKVLTDAFFWLGGELAGTYYHLGELNQEQTQFLLDKGFLFQIPTAKNLLTGAGAARSWPDNRGIFYNEAQTALCWVNEEDHCRIISMENGGDIPSVFTRFCALSNALKTSAEANGTKLMWNDVLGFLGTCPSNLGTGLRASVMIYLPEFNKLMESDNHEYKELLETVCSAFDLQPRGSAGEHSAAVGAKFDISNKQRLGFSEVELVQKMIDGVTKVIKLERQLAAGVSPAKIRASLSELESVLDSSDAISCGLSNSEYEKYLELVSIENKILPYEILRSLVERKNKCREKSNIPGMRKCLVEIQKMNLDESQLSVIPPQEYYLKQCQELLSTVTEKCVELDELADYQKFMACSDICLELQRLIHHSA